MLWYFTSPETKHNEKGKQSCRFASSLKHTFVSHITLLSMAHSRFYIIHKVQAPKVNVKLYDMWQMKLWCYLSASSSRVSNTKFIIVFVDLIFTMLRLYLLVVKFWLKYKPYLICVLQWEPSFKFLNNKSTIQGTPQKRLYSDDSLLPRGNFKTLFHYGLNFSLDKHGNHKVYYQLYIHILKYHMNIYVHSGAVSQNKLFTYFSVESNVNPCTVLGTFLHLWSSQIDNM